MLDSTTFLRRAASWTLALLALAGGLAWWTLGKDMALGVALGALVGLLNLVVLSRSLSRVLANPEQHRPAPGKNWVLPAAVVLKWPFLLLVLGLILWYMPARPEGVAAGVLLSLLAATIAALRGKSRARPPSQSNS